jgi:hypothetical protein
MLKKKQPAKKAPAAAPSKKSAPSSKTSTDRRITPASNKTLAAPTPNFEADQHAGQEGMSAQDYQIPRLVILQDLSPQVKKTEAAYIDGAEPGDICDVLTGTLYSGSDGITVVPISYRRTHLEWVPRAKGGGFAGDHGPDGKILEQCTKDDNGNMVLKNGNHVKVTCEYYVMLVDEETGEHTAFALSMTGAQIKKARRWNTMMNQLRAPAQGGGTFNPAMFFRSYKLTTTPERNDKGSWFGWNITPDKNTVDFPNGNELYLAAREFRQSIASGAVKAAAPHSEEAGGGTSAESDETPM